MAGYGTQGPPPGGNVNQGTSILIVIVVTFALVLLLFGLRLVTRIFIVRSMGWDDYTIIAATITSSLAPRYVRATKANKHTDGCCCEHWFQSQVYTERRWQTSVLPKRAA
jgi:hypothetical protein